MVRQSWTAAQDDCGATKSQCKALALAAQVLSHFDPRRVELAGVLTDGIC